MKFVPRFALVMVLATLLPKLAWSQQQPTRDPVPAIVRDGMLKELQRIRGTQAALFVLQEQTKYCDPLTGIIIEVPKGFVTDFASIPWWAKWFQDPLSEVGNAAIVHDWLYAIAKPEGTDANSLGGGRAFADRVFRSYLIETGVKESRANALFEAVRAGGQKGFQKCSTETPCPDFMFADVAQRTVIEPPISLSAARNALGRQVNVGCTGSEWRPSDAKTLERVKNYYLK
jgi:hypothetical protein